MNDKLTQEVIIKEFFTSHPNQDIPHTQVIDWVVEEWKKRTDKVFERP